MNKTELRQLFGEPKELVREAHAPILDATAMRFIGTCRFLLISTINEDGYIDISPRGGDEGFIKIVDDKTIEFLDIPGNRKILTFSNLVNNDKVGLLFIVAGNSELLRVYGRAELITDENEILDCGGRVDRNKVLVRIHVNKVFPHCGNAMSKANFWDAETWGTSADADFPTLKEMAIGMAAARGGN